MSDYTSNLLLPETFEPGETEVLVGRGKRCAEHDGNKRLKEIVRSQVAEYVVAKTKREKSTILNKVVMFVRSKSVHQAGFVKHDKRTGRWSVVEDAAARITTAQVFRDALSNHYKSSRQFKQQRRQDQKDLTMRTLLPQHNTSPPAQAKYSTEFVMPDPQDLACAPSYMQGRLASIAGPPFGTQNAVLSNLFKTLGEIEVDLSENPFEPTPLSANETEHWSAFASTFLVENLRQHQAPRIQSEITKPPSGKTDAVAETDTRVNTFPQEKNSLASLMNSNNGVGRQRVVEEGLSSLADIRMSGHQVEL